MEFCHSFGKDASLVVIETQLENTYLKKWLLKHGTNKYETYEKKDIFIIYV